MSQYREGDSSSFAVLYGRHKGPSFRYFLRQGVGSDASQELFQDVWASVIKAAPTYKASARFTTWLYRIAHNRLVDHWRAKQKRDAVEGSDIIPLGAGDPDMNNEPVNADQTDQRTPERELQAREQWQQFATAFEQIPVEQKTAFILKQEAGLSVEEIAEITGVSRETAKSRLRYAHGKLKAAIGGDQ